MQAGSTVTDPVVSAAITDHAAITRWVIGIGALGLLTAAAVLFVTGALVARRRRRRTTP